MLKHIKENTTFISELLAAVAIVAGGVTYMHQTFWKPRTVDIKMQIASSTARVLSLLITNEGGRDVVLTSGRVKSSIGDDKLSAKLQIKEDGELIKKGESVLVSPAPGNLSSTVLATTKLDHIDKMSTTECAAELEFVDVTGTRQVREVKFTCYAACLID